MEIREWALRIFSADCLSEKLLPPPGGIKALTDQAPGSPVAWRRPPRVSRMEVAPKNRRKKFPHPEALGDPEMRARCLHSFANHELMALEMMAWALLAFPTAEPSFRRGLAKILQEEQEHFQLYCQRLRGLGVEFGDLPVNDHFWRAADSISDPLGWICSMHLTFEQANLDNAPYFSRLFARVEDFESSALMNTIFEDEIRHVRFGATWLKRYCGEQQSLFEAFQKNCARPYPAERAVGPEFQAEARLRAGLDHGFVDALRAHSKNVG